MNKVARVKVRIKSLKPEALRKLLDVKPDPIWSPYMPPVVKEHLGCRVCGVGSDGGAIGYVCPRTDCPSRITCGSYTYTDPFVSMWSVN